MIPKFRAYDQKWHEWLTDSYVGLNGKLYQKNKDTAYGTAVSVVNSDNVILMQSTGLFDKNGVEIFEKDIIKNKDGRLAIVKWHASYASFVYIWLDELKKEKQNWQPLYLAYMKFEIIGNVYENPELLVR